nr:DUF364 domain-containing protein [Thermococcus piezophilus]
MSVNETLSDSLKYWLLPEVDAVMASATCILNGTIDMLLDHPTGQVLLEFFKGTGVTHIASMKVVNVEKAVLQLKLGCFRGFSNESKKYVVEP